MFLWGQGIFSPFFIQQEESLHFFGRKLFVDLF